MSKLRSVVDEKQQGVRLDVFVHSLIPAISRAATAKLIENGSVLINKQVTLKLSQRLKAGDKVEVDYAPGQAKVPTIEIPIIYEDQDCLVIDKPVGVLTHSKGDYDSEATVASWLKQKLSKEWLAEKTNNRLGVVHRLDRGTSGVMIVARNETGQKWLQKQFSSRKAKKIYTAIVIGTPNPPEAIIDMPIERNPKKPSTFRPGVGGKPAQTHYRVIKTGSSCSLVELKPTTGRTHQLRVHLKAINHSILGDELYGGGPSERLYLHSTSLEITLPSGQRQVFTSKLPSEFNNIVSKWDS